MTLHMYVRQKLISDMHPKNIKRNWHGIFSPKHTCSG